MNIDVNELEVMEDIASLAVVTGEKKEKYLLWQLEISMAHAKRIDLIVSFLMESGVKMLLPQLKQAQKRGVSIRILTGNYLGITQPSALYLLRSELGDQIDLRFYADSHRSFHPKAYFFHADKESRVFIGSSNISRSALTSGIEWNYCLSSVVDKQAFDQFYSSFEDLFYNKSVEITDTVLKKYAKSWVRPAVAKDLARYEKQGEEEKQSGLKQEYEPRGVQIEALYELERSRKEGAEKGIVHAATGIGKTYLAAFDSMPYKRVLFVAHREEILRQAAEAFHNVRPDDSYGFFTGDKKDADVDLLFASVASLGKEEVLKRKFSPDSFEYIVMDECHHSTADQYQKILDFFHPTYLLGLTATPERMDGRSVYELYDFEVPYEITLKEAVNRGVLVPFHYPQDCIVDFDLKLIDLFIKMEEGKRKGHDAVVHEYNRVKELLQHVPTRVELFTHMDEAVYQYCLKEARENPFRHYVMFRSVLGDLEKEKCAWIGTDAGDFLELIEQTNMQKSYKMPVLSAFCEADGSSENGLKMAVTESDVLWSWKKFYQTGTNWKDVNKCKTKADFENMTDKEHLQLITKNPVNFLKQSGKGFFVDKEGYLIALKDEMQAVLMQAVLQEGGTKFADEIRDIVQYRVLEYYWKRYRDKK